VVALAEDISAVVAAEAVEGTPVEAGAEEEVVVSIQAEGEVVVELAEVVEVAAAIIDCGKRLRKRRVVRGIYGAFATRIVVGSISS
jgi:hypothetical protein